VVRLWRTSREAGQVMGSKGRVKETRGRTECFFGNRSIMQMLADWTITASGEMKRGTRLVATKCHSDI
jgi:hypothetical protein